MPATDWNHAYPVGNGTLGAMVFGGINLERLALNHDTLWSGHPRDGNNLDGPAVLAKVRRALFAGDNATADDLAKHLQGAYGESYLPLGDLHMAFDHEGQPTDYHRELDLARAIATTRYRVGDTAYCREVFASFPNGLLMVRLTAEGHGKLNLSVTLDSKLRFTTNAEDGGRLMMRGVAPSRVEPSYRKAADPVVYGEPPQSGMSFAAGVGVRGDESLSVRAEGKSLRITADGSVTLMLTAATGYAGYDRMPRSNPTDPEAACRSQLDAMETRDDEAIRSDHLADHAALFGRTKLKLTPTRDDIPTARRIAEYRADRDPGLVGLVFDFGRYLMIAGSRPGTQPSNLQGIWNQDVRPPWSSNWTLNINTQMNYWPVHTANLAECAFPLFDLIDGLAQCGRETARVNYAASGWVAHHNTDLWRITHVMGNFGEAPTCHTVWPMGGVWLCDTLWEHFRFTGDESFLRDRALPLMQGAAAFMLDYLVEVPDGDLYPPGTLVTAPSTSAENRFDTADGKRVGVDVMCTQDIALLRGLFGNCIAAAEQLNLADDLTRRIRAALHKLPGMPIGDDGRLMEYRVAWNEPEPDHRHLSHLIGLYPGDQIHPRLTPELAAAARRSLEVRGDESTGWSMAWKINCWARLHDGEHALRMFDDMLRLVSADATGDNPADFDAGGGVYPNLFDAHPPFQIDGNFGAAAGVVEMLLQSHTDEIELLPALPIAWPQGQASGLRARGGFTLDLAWDHGTLVEAKIVAEQKGPCCVRFGNAVLGRQSMRPGEVWRIVAADFAGRDGMEPAG